MSGDGLTREEVFEAFLLMAFNKGIKKLNHKKVHHAFFKNTYITITRKIGTILFSNSRLKKEMACFQNAFELVLGNFIER